LHVLINNAAVNLSQRTVTADGIKTIGEACRQQAQALIEALLLYASKQLEQGQKAEELFAFLFAKQQAFASA
jgi:hypothetical protein